MRVKRVLKDRLLEKNIFDITSCDALTIHVALGLGELHLVHALAGVPMQEGFTSEHGRELFGNSLEEFLK